MFEWVTFLAQSYSRAKQQLQMSTQRLWALLWRVMAQP
jgi:hypothetical protein